MKSETRDMLVIEANPLVPTVLLSVLLSADVAAILWFATAGKWVPAAMLVFVLPWIVGGLFVFVRRTTVVLDRPKGLVTIRVAALRGQTATSLPLADVTGAVVQVSKIESEGGPTYRPALTLAGGGARELVWIYASRGGAERAVAAINRWLASGRGKA